MQLFFFSCLRFRKTRWRFRELCIEIPVCRIIELWKPLIFKFGIEIITNSTKQIPSSESSSSLASLEFEGSLPCSQKLIEITSADLSINSVQGNMNCVTWSITCVLYMTLFDHIPRIPSTLRPTCRYKWLKQLHGPLPPPVEIDSKLLRNVCLSLHGYTTS